MFVEPVDKYKPAYGKQLITLVLSVAIVQTGFGIIFPIFPQLLVKVGGGDAADLGYMAASFGLAYFIASPIFGNLADAIGKKKIILVGLIGFSTSNLIYIYATQVWHFYLARAVEGAFASAILPPAIALTTSLTPKKLRARYIGYVVSGNTVGLIIGPLVGGILFDGINISGTQFIQGSIYLPFWVSFATGLFAFLFGILFIPTAQQHEQAAKAMQKQERADAGINEEDYVEPEKLSYDKTIKGIFQHQIDVLPRPLYMFVIFMIADVFTILPWLIVSPGFIFYFYEHLVLTASDFGYFVAGYGMFAAMGQAFLGNLSDTYGRKPLMLIGQAFAIGFYLMIPFGFVSWHFILIATLAGISSGLRDPALKAMLSDVTDEESRATAFGIEAGFISISQIAGPIIGGFLYVTQGIQIVFLTAIGISIVNILVISVIRFKVLQEGEAMSQIEVVTKREPNMLEMDSKIIEIDE